MKQTLELNSFLVDLISLTLSFCICDRYIFRDLYLKYTMFVKKPDPSLKFASVIIHPFSNTV